MPLDELKALIADVGDLSDAAAIEADFVDLGETTAFEVVQGEGECSA